MTDPRIDARCGVLATAGGDADAGLATGANVGN